MSEIDRLSDIRRQSRDFEREGYDGHNRRSGFTTMRELSHRRIRRQMNQLLRKTVKKWNNLE